MEITRLQHELESKGEELEKAQAESRRLRTHCREKAQIYLDQQRDWHLAEQEAKRLQHLERNVT